MFDLASPYQACFKLPTNSMQVDCQDFLFTGLMQVVNTTSNKSANIKLHQV